MKALARRLLQAILGGGFLVKAASLVVGWYILSTGTILGLGMLSWVVGEHGNALDAALRAVALIFTLLVASGAIGRGRYGWAPALVALVAVLLALPPLGTAFGVLLFAAAAAVLYGAAYDTLAGG